MPLSLVAALMAAKRLVIALVVILGLATVLTLLLPTPAERRDVATTAEPTTAGEPTSPVRPPAEPPAGRLLTATVSVRPGQIEVVPIERGDQLELRVRVSRSDEIEIPRLGLIAPATRDSPARFDLLPTALGDYPIRLVSSGKTVARITVARRS